MKRTYRTTDPTTRVILVIEAIRSLSPPTVTFPNGKSVAIEDVARIVAVSGYNRTTVRYWIKTHDGYAWRVSGNEVGLLPLALSSSLLVEPGQPQRVWLRRATHDN
jgi:hypothetical protein